MNHMTQSMRAARSRLVAAAVVAAVACGGPTTTTASAPVPVAAAPVVSAPAAQAPAPQRPAPGNTLPDRLSDAEFWKLASDISEPGGYFRIEDNFTSNEM